MSLRKLFVFILFLAVAPHAAFGDVGVFVEGGVHFGGDTIVNVPFSDGTTEPIKAGELLSGSLGVESDVTDALLLKLSAGIKLDLILAKNGEVSFERIPIEAVLFLKGEKVHLGAGVTYHTNVKLKGDFSAGIPTVDFDDATGYVVQLDYILNEGAFLSLKYTAIDYQISSGSPKYDGNSIGILIGLRFGK